MSWLIKTMEYSVVMSSEDVQDCKSMILGSRNRAAEHREGDEGYEHDQDVNSSYIHRWRC